MRNCFITVVTALFAFASCTGDIESETGKGLSYPLTEIGLTKAYDAMVVGQQDFGVNFFKSVAQQNIHNVIMSPFSISLDLAMLSAGTEGKTYDELVKGLGFESFTPEMLAEYYSSIIDCNTAITECTFKTANALWINSGNNNVKQSYLDDVEGKYKATAECYRFGVDPVKDVINGWASKNTDGMIGKILDEEPSASCSLILTNALLFEGKWYAISNGYNVVTKEFTDISGKKASRDFFCGDLCSTQFNTDWSDPKQPALIELPYMKGFRMVIIVPPAKNTSIKDFVGSLKASDIRNWRAKETASGHCFSGHGDLLVHFFVPKFKSEFDLNRTFCKKALKDNGISRIFSPGGFGRMSDDESLCVDDVHQRAVIEVDENGTKAAAVTSISMYDGAVMVEYDKEYDFVVDRPFVYAILDNYGSILFMGTMTE